MVQIKQKCRHYDLAKHIVLDNGDHLQSTDVSSQRKINSHVWLNELDLQTHRADTLEIFGIGILQLKF